jgi:uncharacterized protein (DUF2141 family)
MLAGSALMLLQAMALASSPELGKAEGQCRANENGPSFLVAVEGLKDRQGLLKLEVYPSNDADFLADDNVLLNAGKVFRRVEEPVPARGAVQICIRVPGPGPYALSLLHDRDANRKFGLSVDGIGFAANPRLGFSKPRADHASVAAGNGPTRTVIVMNYRRGLIGFGPLKDKP